MSAYTIELDESEYNALCWLADRYVCAETLWTCAVAPDDFSSGRTLEIPEHVAWRYVEELKAENGNPRQLVPPCAGGSLAAKLMKFLDSII